MRYVIISYTCTIDIKNNTAKIRYLSLHLNEGVIAVEWADDIKDAYTFSSRALANDFITNQSLKHLNLITYGVEDEVVEDEKES